MTSFNFKFLVILIVFAFLEVVSVPLDLVVVAVAVWAFFRLGKEVLVEAFIAGLAIDFLGKFTLGTNAALVVLVALLILTVKEGFLALKTRPVELTFWLAIPFLIIPLAFAIIVYQPLLTFIEHRQVSFYLNSGRLIGDLILAVLIYPLFSFLSLRWQTDQPVQLDFRKKL